MTREQEVPLSLGHTAIHANGMEGLPVVALNYVNPDFRLLLNDPRGDRYLPGAAVPAAREGETVVAPKMIPGLLEHYRRIGLVNDRMRIVQVTPVQTERPVPGYPATDVLEGLRGREVFPGNQRHILTPTFTNRLVAEQQRALGLESLGRPDSATTNNKASFREAARAYDYNVLPGDVIYQWGDLPKLLETFKDLPHGVWVKFPTGSGGDFVRHVDKATMFRMLRAERTLRKAAFTAFQNAEFPITADEFWPRDEFTPANLGIVVESDARNLGRLAVSGSTQFVTYRDGTYDVIGHFQLMTSPSGEYVGNRPFRPHPETQRRIEEQIGAVARYNADENGYYGIQGDDWYLIDQKHDDTPVRDSRYPVRYRPGADHTDEQLYNGELNSRPTANTPPVIMAQKLGMPASADWININVECPEPIESFEHFAAMVGDDLAGGDFNDPRGGLVTIQAARTLVGETGILEPSPKAKLFIGGSSPQHCDRIVETLEQRGIKIG